MKYYFGDPELILGLRCSDGRNSVHQLIRGADHSIVRKNGQNQIQGCLFFQLDITRVNFRCKENIYYYHYYCWK